MHHALSMCMQAADVAHEGEKKALKTTIRLREDQLQQQEAENRKLDESAEAKYQNALKRQDELSEKLDSKDEELAKVQGEAAELEAKYHAAKKELAEVKEEWQALRSDNARRNSLANELPNGFVPDINERPTLDVSMGGAAGDTGQPAASATTGEWVRKRDYDQLLARFTLVSKVMQALSLVEEFDGV